MKWIQHYKIEIKYICIPFFLVGGNANMRKYWSNFIPDAGVLVFVIDSSDRDRFEEAKEELYNLLKDSRVKRLPLLIVANKQVQWTDYQINGLSSNL